MRASSSAHAIGLGFGQPTNELLVADLLEALQPGTVRAFDPDRSIQGEPYAVVPAGHLARVGGIESAGMGEPAQRARTCCCTAVIIASS